MRYLRVGCAREFRSGEGRTVEVDGRPVAVFRIDGSYYAIDDRCSHMGGPLGQGRVVGGCVVCPWHGARFELGSGRVKAPPAGRDVACFPVKRDGDDVFVGVES